MGGPSLPPEPTQLEQAQQRRKDLATALKNAANITDRTREEFTREFEGLQTADQVLQGRQAGTQARIDEMVKELQNLTSSSSRRSQNSNRVAQLETGIQSLRQQLNNQDITSEEFEAIGATESDFQARLDAAIRGEGRFGKRQRRQAQIKLLEDRPGARQTRASLLGSNPSDNPTLLG